MRAVPPDDGGPHYLREPTAAAGAVDLSHSATKTVDSNQDTALNTIHVMYVEESPPQEAHVLTGARSASLWRTRGRSLDRF
jgi:hypothetical protein